MSAVLSPSQHAQRPLLAGKAATYSAASGSWALCTSLFPAKEVAEGKLIPVLPTCLHIYLYSTYLPTYLPVHVSICLSINLTDAYTYTYIH